MFPKVGFSLIPPGTHFLGRVIASYGEHIVSRYNDGWKLPLEQKPTSSTKKLTSARRLASARENGSEGGRQRAAQYSGDVLSEWASHGSKAVLAKYGSDYFAQLRKRRKNYPKQNESPMIPPNWRSITARQNGQKGGLARAERYTHLCFREWGRLGGMETLVRHGQKFYREIRKKRKYYNKPGYMTPKTKVRLRKYCERMARKAKSPIRELWEAEAKNLAT